MESDSKQSLVEERGDLKVSEIEQIKKIGERLSATIEVLGLRLGEIDAMLERAVSLHADPRSRARSGLAKAVIAICGSVTAKFIYDWFKEHLK